MDLWKATRDGDLGAVEKLLTLGLVPVDERGDLGETALHVAASRGHDELVALLLRHGADLRLADGESGWTALHRSLYHQHLTTSLLLLRHARIVHGRQYMKEYLYETRDRSGLSPMELVSMCTSNGTDEPRRRNGQEIRGGMVYTFGKVDFQLGYHLPHVNVQSSPRLVELPITSTITQISASKFHTVAVNDQGHVYVWGFGKGGRLGTGKEFDHVEPVRLTSLNETPISKVAAGENHTLALAANGQVFSWGSNSFGQLGHTVKSLQAESRLAPKRIDAFRGMTMMDIAVSGSHSAAICADDGSLYTWGSNKRGQLGQKEGFGTDQPNPAPKRVDRLVAGNPLSVIYESYDSVRVVQVAMSDLHTCAVLRCSKHGQSHGQVWQFGYGSNVPSRINFKEKRRANSQLMMDTWVPHWKLLSSDIIAVSCAPNHSIALSACGSVYTWGHNGDALSHQHSSKKNLAPGAPQRVLLDKYDAVVSICASQDHCAVVTRSGDLITWGGGHQGVLGHGPGNSWQPSPKRVHGAKKVISVSAGHQHTVLLVAPRLPTRSEVVTTSGTPVSLRTLLQDRISSYLDITNVATVWKYASTYSQTALAEYCEQYMRANWDAVLDMGGKDNFGLLFDLMLPSVCPRVIPSHVQETVRLEAKSSACKGVKSPLVVARKTSVAKLDVNPGTESPCAPVMLKPNIPNPSIEDDSHPPGDTVLKESNKHDHSTTRRSKPTKFVKLDVFLAAKEKKPCPRDVGRCDERWITGHVPDQQSSVCRGMIEFPVLGVHTDSRSHTQPKQTIEKFASPLLTSRSCKPVPTSGPARKQLVGHDGLEHAQPSAFTLDAFIKKGVKKKTRTESSGRSAPSWGAPPAKSEQEHLKSLKEIQAEEAARAESEAAAKSRNGGFVRKSSTLNSWGLVEQHQHISLADLQKKEEEERLIEEQRQILAQIELENKRRAQAQQRRTRPHNEPTSRDRKKDKTCPSGNNGESKPHKEKSKTKRKTKSHSEAIPGAGASTENNESSSKSAKNENKGKKRPPQKTAKPLRPPTGAPVSAA